MVLVILVGFADAMALTFLILSWFLITSYEDSSSGPLFLCFCLLDDIVKSLMII